MVDQAGDADVDEGLQTSNIVALCPLQGRDALLRVARDLIRVRRKVPRRANPQASRFRIHSTSGAGTKRHLRKGPAMTLR
jgi:hypothetical protein